MSDSLPIDTGIPHSARIWNYWLGGKDNFEVDRAAGEQILALVPDLVTSARADRAFLRRAVEHLAGAAGVRQFLDIGTGLPTADNTHQVAQELAPDSRIVYVDNDPLVLVHARALLTSSAQGATAYVDADLHDPDRILAGARGTLDLGKPVAVMMLGVLNFVFDDAEAQEIVGRLMAAVPSGSYLVFTHPTVELGGEMNVPAMAFYNKRAIPKIRARDRVEVEPWLAGLDVVEPGLVSASLWRPDAGREPVEMPLWAAVARKP